MHAKYKYILNTAPLGYNRYDKACNQLSSISISHFGTRKHILMK